MTIMQTTHDVPHQHDPHPEDEQYESFRKSVTARFNEAAKNPLFLTSVSWYSSSSPELFTLFLDNIPGQRRQHYNCRACQHFINRFGGLVTIDENGNATSAVWDLQDTPLFFHESVGEMLRVINRSKVTGVFISGEATLGHPHTPSPKGDWFHFNGAIPTERLHRSKVLTPFQAMAEKVQDHHNVARALSEYSLATVDQALKLLRSEQLYRAEKVIGPAEWLAKLHEARANVVMRRGNDAQDNLIWRAVADAPAGFCHPRSSMIGTLLDDIAAGLPFADVSRKFAEKMHPLQYQRPQAAPAAGNIKQAEELFEKLGLARALPRRFARLEEIETIWKPQPPRMVPRRAGVFGNVKAKGEVEKKSSSMATPRITMTWEKFQRTVLPTAETIEFYTDPRVGNFSAFLTAVNPDAPPILQWDREEKRNPFSWYFWHGGSSPRTWGLYESSWVNVTGVALKPNMWGDQPLVHQGEGVLFVLAGAVDQRSPSLCLFPEILRSELHGVRAVIEAYSKDKRAEERMTATVCGVMLKKGRPSPGDRWHFVFRVNGEQEYLLDRWD